MKNLVTAALVSTLIFWPRMTLMNNNLNKEEVSSFYLIQEGKNGQGRHRLENHPMCGRTTGGQEECYFKCGRVSCVPGYDTLVDDLTCIRDCFENNSCVAALLDDVLSEGVCIDDGLGFYPVSKNCTPFQDSTCSDRTEALLTTRECLQEVFSQQHFILNTINHLITISCHSQVAEFYFNFQVSNSLAGSAGSRRKRSVPLSVVLESEKISTKLNFTNTRHRYPWVCSLRRKGDQGSHVCAVNLLSLPPSPTVLVGAAHCPYLCKDGSREIPSCCCSSNTDSCRYSDARCGDHPGVVEMDGQDARIVCGEGDTSQDDSEEYNIVMTVRQIVRHPGYDPAVGVSKGSDLAIFKVNDRNLKKALDNRYEVWPACLPPAGQGSTRARTGIHTGWSKPPPLSFVESVAPGYAGLYDNFYKQWHYKMDILETCEDPKDSPLCASLKYPSNSSYPPGTVCARDFTRQSCFSTGDSGSPLMTSDNDDRRYIEGVLSFVKGCDQFIFGLDKEEFSTGTTYTLTQRSTNPATYTRLSCFLPWIAAQYNMEYSSTGAEDQTCTAGSGDTEDKKNICRNTLSNEFDLREEAEFECIFPFYYNGKKYDECILFEELGFVYPVFRCPIRRITTKMNGIISFNFNASAVTGGYCIKKKTSPGTPEHKLVLDPDYDGCASWNRRPPMSQCKNNCPGVRAFGLGGGAVLPEKRPYCETAPNRSRCNKKCKGVRCRYARCQNGKCEKGPNPRKVCKGKPKGHRCDKICKKIGDCKVAICRTGVCRF